ncbi:hypothetical protein MNB_SUP05-SYMBIONT-5-202 [hydrothermal vent metagenome]|uniref:Uncharacterized protein n=1 Tax=hydrothermal vent metagenome TaxID=652676 RepID=A0A1W1E5Z7_9ZZZZ
MFIFGLEDWQNDRFYYIVHFLNSLLAGLRVFLPLEDCWVPLENFSI